MPARPAIHPPYRPDKFEKAFANLQGAALWDFLHRPETVAALQTAVVLRRPGVEAIAPSLLTKFPHQTRKLKFRQMVGHMIRQVMEENGFTLGRANVRISRRSILFRYGSVYQAK